MKPRIVIIVCDGLRPDRVDPIRTPALWRLRAEGTWYANSRTVFPSETRVAAASLVTGALPGAHGLLANDFYDPTIFPDRAIATASADDLAEIARVRGRLLARLTLAERLSAHGLRYAVVSTASPGTSRILATGAQPPSGFVWSIHSTIAAPDSASAEVARRFGPLPTHAIPRNATIDYAARVFTDYVLPEIDPDVAIFWCGEPDSTYHYRGVGSPEAAQAEAAADGVVARILDWREHNGESERTQLIVTSDHGHITGIERLNIAATLRAGGWRVAERSPSDDEIVVVPGSASFVSFLRPDARREKEFLSWLADQPWFGAAFTRGGDGEAATIDTLGLSHPRQPDLVFTLRHSDQLDGLGLPGVCVYDSELPLGGGMHGGLHARELSNLLILSGAMLRTRSRVMLPAGLVDIAPTVLNLLGLPLDNVEGRVLIEALTTTGVVVADAIRHEQFRPVASLTPCSLLCSRLGAARYLDGLVTA